MSRGYTLVEVMMSLALLGIGALVAWTRSERGMVVVRV